MSKLGTTVINGNLIVAGDIICKSDDSSFRSNSVDGKALLVSKSNFLLPMVIWHGLIKIASSPIITIYHASACNINVTYISTGLISVSMSGDNMPKTSDEYQLMISSRGGGTNNNDPTYVTCPQYYKTNSYFRLLMTSGTSTRDGQVELSIVKMVKLNK